LNSLELVPLGQLVIHAEESWQIPGGPRGLRSVTRFREVVWSGGPIEARSVWANGTYLSVAGVTEPEIRALFRCEDESLLFLHYQARFAVGDQGTSPGDNPVYLAGRVETDAERYTWLNATQVVGKGGFDTKTLALTYEVHALR
jgi:hypothetical protein